MLRKDAQLARRGKCRKRNSLFYKRKFHRNSLLHKKALGANNEIDTRVKKVKIPFDPKS